MFTFSCQTSAGKPVCFYRFWYQTQSNFDFDGFLSYIFYINPMRDRDSFIINNSDKQKRREIIKSLKEIFPNAVKGDCNWYVGEYFLWWYLQTSTIYYLIHECCIIKPWFKVGSFRSISNFIEGKYQMEPCCKKIHCRWTLGWDCIMSMMHTSINFLFVHSSQVIFILEMPLTLQKEIHSW